MILLAISLAAVVLGAMGIYFGRTGDKAMLKKYIGTENSTVAIVLGVVAIVIGAVLLIAMISEGQIH